MRSSHQILRFKTLDLVAALPLIAFGLIVLNPFLERVVIPSRETRAILYFIPTPLSIKSFQTGKIDDRLQPQIEALAHAVRHSPQAAKAIRNDPLLSDLPPSLTAEDLQQELRERLRIQVIPNTYLVIVAMPVDDPERD